MANNGPIIGSLPITAADGSLVQSMSLFLCLISDSDGDHHHRTGIGQLALTLALLLFWLNDFQMVD